jgi:YggT family protein
VTIVRILATIAYLILTVYFIVLWARLVLDLARAFRRDWRPKGIGLVLAEAVYALTDPPIKALRRVLPPLRVGGIALDFGWSIVMIACVILLSVTTGFMR